MISRSEIANLASLTNEARQAVIGAFDALSSWRDEIFHANDRCLTKALDQMAMAHRAMGWPDHITAAAREQLLKASKVQTHMIDQVMDTWEQQLLSSNIPASLPERLAPRMHGLAGTAFTDPVSDMLRFGEMSLVPFRLWIQAAEAWQRNWAAAMSGAALPRPPRPSQAGERAARPPP